MCSRELDVIAQMIAARCRNVSQQVAVRFRGGATKKLPRFVAFVTSRPGKYFRSVGPVHHGGDRDAAVYIADFQGEIPRCQSSQ